MNHQVDRRAFGAALLGVTGALAVERLKASGKVADLRPSLSRVAILHADSYGLPLDRTVLEGLRLFGLEL